MAIVVTVEILRATYDLLKTTRPFRTWKLPPAEEIDFRVLKTNTLSGDYVFSQGKHVIRLSRAKHTTLHAVTMTVAHEVCHMVDPSRSHHGAVFKRLARLVCKHHGFDIGQF